MLPKKRTLLIVVLLIAFGGSLHSAVTAKYMGVALCKMCHFKQYQSWNKTDHAKAFQILRARERTSMRCIPCHATGMSDKLPGVQCEACHGPGSEYYPLSIMKDPQASYDKGLRKPTETLCLRCHNRDAPHKVSSFIYERDIKKVMHAKRSGK